MSAYWYGFFSCIVLELIGLGILGFFIWIAIINEEKNNYDENDF